MNLSLAFAAKTRHLPPGFPPNAGLKFQQNTCAEYPLRVLCSGMLKTDSDIQVIGADQFVFVTRFSDSAHRRIVSWNTKLNQSQKLVNKGVVN
jgi:hypothetical protein